MIIPETNRKNLMLRDEIAAAVSAGKFHLYTVSTVDEGLTLLTGREAGAELEDGSFPPGYGERGGGQAAAAVWRDAAPPKRAGGEP